MSLGGGGGAPAPPERSAEELDLMRQQTALLKQQETAVQQQLQQQQLLAPFLFENAGLIPTISQGTPASGGTPNPAYTSLQQQLTDARAGGGGPLDTRREIATGPNSFEPNPNFNKPLGGGGVDPERIKTLEQQLAGTPQTIGGTPATAAGTITGFTKDPVAVERQKLADEQLAQSLQLSIQQVEMAREQLEILKSELPSQQALRAAQTKLTQLGVDISTQQLEAIQKDEEQFGELRREITGTSLERELAALKGELPVSAAILGDFDDAKTQLQDAFRLQLGSGYETSTPFIEANAEFEANKAEVLDSVRRGEITNFGALNAARAGQSQQSFAQAMGIGEASNPFFGGATVNTGIPGQQTASAGNIPGQTFGAAGNFGSIAQGFNAPISGFQNQRSLEHQSNLASFQADQNASSGLGQLFGTVAGSFIGGPAFGAGGAGFGALFS